MPEPILAAAPAPLDMLIVVAGLGVMLFVGLRAGRGERDTRDFFLGGRSVPAWAVCLSFVATEVSAATIVGVPADAFKTNWFYLQMFIGSALARLAVALLFIPAFYRFDCTTIYEFLGRRFGPSTQLSAVILFFVTRLTASGVRLYAAAMGAAIILGLQRGSLAGEAAIATGNRAGLTAAIAAFTLVGIGFIAFGGIKAVIWSNVVQAAAFIIGGVAALGFLIWQIDGGAATVIETARTGGRLQIVNPTMDFSDAKALPVMIAVGFLTSLAVFGTDQDLMQRLLTVETRRASQRSLIATIVVALPTLVLFLCVGTALYAYYTQHAAAPRPANSDEILPFFAGHVMPAGLRGLVLLAIVMASIDSPLGSLSSAFVTDIYRPLIRPGADERHYLRVSRICVAVFGVILGVVAFACSYLSGLIWVAFQVLSVTGGSLLGVFLLGLLTDRRGRDKVNAIAMFTAVAVTGQLMVLIHRGAIALGWTWLIVIGTLVTFLIGAAFPSRATLREWPHRDSSHDRSTPP